MTKKNCFQRVWKAVVGIPYRFKVYNYIFLQSRNSPKQESIMASYKEMK